MVWTEITALVVFSIFALVGLVIILLGFPGTFLVVLGAFLGDLILTDFTFGWKLYLLFILIAVFGELFDFLAAGYVAKKFKASRWGVAGAIIGGIVGASLGSVVPIIGNIIGLFIGAIALSFLFEFIAQKKFEKAFKAAIGAFFGRVGAIIVKIILAIIIIVIVFTKVI
jgi:uncharacterized protein YqgC (DUF456 family)